MVSRGLFGVWNVFGNGNSSSRDSFCFLWLLWLGDWGSEKQLRRLTIIFLWSTNLLAALAVVDMFIMFLGDATWDGVTIMAFREIFLPWSGIGSRRLFLNGVCNLFSCFSWIVASFLLDFSSLSYLLFKSQHVKFYAMSRNLFLYWFSLNCWIRLKSFRLSIISDFKEACLLSLTISSTILFCGN